MKFSWRIRDVVAFMETYRNGTYPYKTPNYENSSMDDTPDFPVQQHDVNWPSHMEFKIEDNVPVPARWDHIKSKYNTALKSTMDSLAVSQSFLIPDAFDEQRAASSEGCKILNMARKHLPSKKFITRTVREDGKITGIRVWRLE